MPTDHLMLCIGCVPGDGYKSDQSYCDVARFPKRPTEPVEHLTHQTDSPPVFLMEGAKQQEEHAPRLCRVDWKLQTPKQNKSTPSATMNLSLLLHCAK